MRRIIPVLLLAVAACATIKKETVPVAEAQPPAPAIEKVATVAPRPVVPTCQADADCTAGQLCLESRCVAISSTTAECDALSTHFDFDQSTIRPEDFPTLQRAARCLQARPATKVRIEGNCDDRGTAAYNLALGQRRASAAQKYLVDLGVQASRTSTVTYGKEQPRCTEQTEPCRGSNRRDDLLKVSERLATAGHQ